MSAQATTTYQQALDRPRAEVVRIAYSVGFPIAHPDNKDVTAFLEEQFYQGYLVELEHGTKYGVSSLANLTNNDPASTLKIAWAHILEDPAYYYRLSAMEAQGEHLADTLRDGSQCHVNRVLKAAIAHLKPHRSDQQANTMHSSSDDEGPADFLAQARNVLQAPHEPNVQQQF